MPDEVPNPTPEPKPATFSKEWWLKQLMLVLPTNWRQIVQWLILVGVMWLIGKITGNEYNPPPPPLPFFDLIIPDANSLDASTREELEKRNIRVRCTGWKKPNKDEQLEVILFATKWDSTEAASGGDGPEDDAPVWRFHEKVLGQPIPAHDQGQIGSCVSFGSALAAELSLASKIHGKRGPPQQYSANIREAIYGGSRINVDPRNPIRGGDGSTGARASKWMSTVGGLLPTADRGPYTVSRCRQWGDQGVPADLVAECQKNPCKTALVTSAEQARIALQQGYAIFVCSDQGFTQTRDDEGFLRPSGQWLHSMCIAGYRGDARKGFLIINSWGANWVKGPTGKFADIPPGSFWADVATVDRMLKQEDSYAVSDVSGFPRRKLTPSDWTVQRERNWLEPMFALAP